MSTISVIYDESIDPLTVQISWEKPDENSEPISEYEILFLAKDGETWTEDEVNCKADAEPYLS